MYTPDRYTVDPIAFCKALVCAPLLVALLGFWAFLIPVFAVVLGGIPYLVLGTPILLWALPKYGPNPKAIAFLAFLTVMITLSALEFSRLIIPHVYGRDLTVIGAFGLVFAPLWGATFAKLYQRMESPTFAAFNA